MNDIIHYIKFKKLLKNWEKYVFYWEKWNFEHIGNSVHNAEFLALGKVLDIYIEYLMFYPSRRHVKWKYFKYKFTFNKDFMFNKELNLCNCNLCKYNLCKFMYVPFPASWPINTEDALLITYYDNGIYYPE